MKKINQIVFFIKWLNLRILYLLPLSSTWAILILSLSANSATLPNDAGVTNVKSFGARGDGRSDDTQAIQTAIENGNRFIYLPNGTYIVCDTLKISQSRKRYFFEGESRNGTIIKLKDNCPGFENSNNPKPVINTEGTPGQAFQNSVFDLTVDIGSGNPGAIAIKFLNNNQGTIRNVTLKSSDPNKKGNTGIDLTLPWPGPGIIKDVQIMGFDYGIKIGFPEYSMVFENVNLSNQRVAGIYNNANLLSIRNLISNNSVPVIRSTDSRSLVVIIDGNFQGGSSSSSAIENENGIIYARNLSTSGYQSVIKNGWTVIPGNKITEYVSKNVYSLFPSSEKSLNLPVKEVPTGDEDSFNNWVSVTKYGANGEDENDDTLAIQKAIDSGKSTIYFPKGKYYISDTIHIRGKVKRITGLGSTLAVKQFFSEQNKPVFQFENSDRDVVTLERFWGDYSNGKEFYWVEHASSKTLFLRNIAVGTGKAYRNTGSGNLFIEDVTASEWIFNHQKVWARQLNPEGNNTQIINNGGILWILGLKTEHEGSAIQTINGGKTEVLGGLLYPASGKIPEDRPAFINDQSQLSVVIAESHHGGARYNTFVEEIRDGVTKKLLSQDLPRRGSASIIPLYVGDRGKINKVSLVDNSKNPQQFQIELNKFNLLEFLKRTLSQLFS